MQASFLPDVTLKMGPRLLKSDQFFCISNDIYVKSDSSSQKSSSNRPFSTF